RCRRRSARSQPQQTPARPVAEREARRRRMDAADMLYGSRLITARQAGETDMPQGHCTISHGLWQAMQRQHTTTGASLGHLGRTALAEYLHVSYSTLFQVSTSAAL